MKRLSVLTLAVLLAVSAVATAQASTANTVVIDGKARTFDPAPIYQNNRTLVPLRQLFEAIGAKVDWDPSTGMAWAEKGPMRLELMPYAKAATLNGQNVPLEVPVTYVNNRTFVPLRFASEALGAEVQYDQVSRVITVNSSPVSASADAIPLVKGMAAVFRYNVDGEEGSQYLRIRVTEIDATNLVSYSYQGDPWGQSNEGTRRTAGLTDSRSFNHLFHNGESYAGRDTAPWASRLVVESLRQFGKVDDFLVGGGAITGQTARKLVLVEQSQYTLVVNGRLTTVPVLEAKDEGGFFSLTILDNPANPLVLEVMPLIRGQVAGWRVAHIEFPQN